MPNQTPRTPGQGDQDGGQDQGQEQGQGQANQ
jgi:hypothetical protein